LALQNLSPPTSSVNTLDVIKSCLQTFKNLNPKCSSRFDTLVAENTRSKDHTLDPNLTDADYMTKVEKDYPLPDAALNAMKDGFFNAIRTPKLSYLEADKVIDSAVSDFKAKLLKVNSKAKIIFFNTRHETALRRGDEPVTPGHGRILVFLPDSPRPGIDQYIQLVAASSEDGAARSGQMSVISVDHTTETTKTFYLDKWRNYDAQDKFVSVTRHSPDQIQGGRCMDCHLSGALAIHPATLDQTIYGDDLKAINESIKNNGTQAIQSSPPVGGGGDRYMSDSLFSQCMPKDNFSEDTRRDAMVTKVKKTISSCIGCHSPGNERAPLNLLAFKKQTSYHNASAINDRVVGVRAFLDDQHSTDFSHGMPPNVYLDPETRGYVYDCLKKSYFGDVQNSIPGELTDWVTFLGDPDPALASCFHPSSASAPCATGALSNEQTTAVNSIIQCTQKASQ
jgi:hypothetical protein